MSGSVGALGAEGWLQSIDTRKAGCESFEVQLRRDCKMSGNTKKILRHRRARSLLRLCLIESGGRSRGWGICCDLECFPRAFAVVVGYYRGMHFCETVILWILRRPVFDTGPSAYPVPRSKKGRDVVPNPKHTRKVIRSGSEMGHVPKIVDSHMSLLNRVVLTSKRVRVYFHR